MEAVVPPQGLGLLDLPYELLCEVMEKLEVKDLFPGPLLACRLLTSAALENHSWEKRYKRDLPPSPSGEPTAPPSWRERYRNDSFRWDPFELTLSLPERKRLEQELLEQNRLVQSPKYNIRFTTASEVRPSTMCSSHQQEQKKDEAEQPNVVFDEGGKRVTWLGRNSFVTVRGNRGFSEGVVCFDMVPRGDVPCHNFGVGLIDGNWCCRLNRFLDPEGGQSWMWWAHLNSVHNISITTQPREATRRVTQAWRTGDVLGVRLNLPPRGTRTIEFFKNGMFAERIDIPSDVTTLWPAAILYTVGDSVELILRASDTYK
ncbi:hypothetical protein QOT17_013324 [Balamuthia mandrillaris]